MVSSRVRARILSLSWRPVQRSKASARVRDRDHGVRFRGQGASARVRERVIMLCRSEVQGLWLELSSPMLICPWVSKLFLSSSKVKGQR